MPDLHSDIGTTSSKHQKGTRRSERPKKPPSRYNDDAGFLIEPPKSAKKKVAQGENSEGTTSIPLLMSDWSNSQLSCYCDACGIDLDDSENDCFNHILKLEQARFSPFKRLAETSVEVREN